jgi:hypothetical protein
MPDSRDGHLTSYPILRIMSAGEPLKTLVNEAFRRWQLILSVSLRAEGVSAQRAASLATPTVAAIKGTVAKRLSAQSIEPLLCVQHELERLCSTVIPSNYHEQERDSRACGPVGKIAPRAPPTTWPGGPSGSAGQTGRLQRSLKYKRLCAPLPPFTDLLRP